MFQKDAVAPGSLEAFAVLSETTREANNREGSQTANGRSARTNAKCNGQE